MKRLGMVIAIALVVVLLFGAVAFGTHAKHHRACSTRWPNAVCRQHRGTR